jgi:hypothetical protein
MKDLLYPSTKNSVPRKIDLREHPPLAFCFLPCHNQFMPSRASKPKRPRDSNLLARSVVEELIGETMEGKPLPPREPEREKNPAAVALSKLGASKGGKARAESLSPKKRRMIALKAARARWGK